MNSMGFRVTIHSKGYGIDSMSIYLDYVILWPDDGYFTAEICCLEVNYSVLTNC